MCFGSLAMQGCESVGEPVPEPEITSSEITRTASPTAQTEFGISFWKVGGTRAATLTGLDADGQRVAEFRTKVLKDGNIEIRQAFPSEAVDIVAPDGSLVVAQLSPSSKRMISQAAADLKDQPVGYDAACDSASATAAITCADVVKNPKSAPKCAAAVAIAAWYCTTWGSDGNDNCAQQNGSEGTCGSGDSGGGDSGGGGGSSGSES